LCIGDDQPGVEDVFTDACSEAVKGGYLKKDDMVISASGSPLFEIGTTNLIQIRKIE
jgi:pyruvate kinase